MKQYEKILYADDDTEAVQTLLRLRIPPLLIGLVLGITISFLTSRFEEVFLRDIRVAFFLPFIVYIADAVGAQTQTIYTRDLKSGKARFRTYLTKELALGIILGLAFGSVSTAIVLVWFSDQALALSVGLSAFFAMMVAPLIALCIAQGAKLLREDPAAEVGPIATVIQDTVSIVIYGIVCSIILL